MPWSWGRFAGAWLLALAVWLGWSAWVGGGWAGLIEQDPFRAVPLPYETAPSRGPVVYFYGDSVCQALEKPEAAGTANLGEGIRAGLAPVLIARGWGYRPSCAAGQTLHHYVAELNRSLDLAVPVTVAIFSVNPRALNKLGENGFRLPPAPNRLKAVTEGRRRQDRRSDAWLLSPLRGALALMRNVLTAELEPKPLTAEPSPKAKDESWERVYGQGYALDSAQIEAGVLAAERLRRQGGLPVFVILPADLKEIALRHPETGKAMDQALREAAQRLRQRGFAVLDMHDAFSDGFIDPPSEHLGAQRRQELAGRIAAFVRASLRG